LQSGDGIGTVDFLGADGNEFVVAASIQAAVDGTPGDNDMPGRLVFLTTADGASSPTERARIDSSGRFGLGTTSVDQLLHLLKNQNGETGVIVENQWGTSGANSSLTLKTADVAGSSYAHFAINKYKNGTVELTNNESNSAANIAFVVGASERARIDSSGRLLIGTSTTGSVVNKTIELHSAGTGLNQPSYHIFANVGATAVDRGYFQFAKSRGSSVGSKTVVASGDALGTIRFNGADGTDYIPAAEINAEVDGTSGTNDMPGRLVFSTTADGANTPTEAMRINNQRELLIGTTTRTANGGVLQVSNGITFPATQSACSDVNTLDDYEEGTWAPVYNFSTSGNANTVSAGRYIKIGSLVYVQAYLYINSSNSLSGDMLITGLPFTSSSSPAQRRYGFSIGYAVRFATDMPNLRLFLEAGASALKMFSNATNAGSDTRLTNSNFTAQAEYNILVFSGSYTV